LRNKQTKFLAFLVCLLAIFPIMGIVLVFAQANRTNSGDVVCPASGSSIEVVPARSSRYSYTINNTSGLDIRIGYLASPSVANLSTSNSWLIKAGQPYSDSAPGVLSTRVVCMSNSAATATISFNETYK